MQVGQKVVKQSPRYGSKVGYISRIEKSQAPAQSGKVVSLAFKNAVYAPGDARVDIIYEDGSEDRLIGERELTSNSGYNKLSLVDVIASAADLEALQSLKICIKEIRDLASQIKAENQANLKAKLIADNPHLTPCISHVDACKNIRIELKNAFPGVKFSVKSRWATHSSAIDIRWTDGPTIKEVETISQKYQYFDNDGSGDHRVNIWGEVFGDARFVSEYKEYSDDSVRRALSTIHAQYCAESDPMPSVDDYRNGRLWNFVCSRYTDQGKPKRFDDLIHRTLTDLK